MSRFLFLLAYVCFIPAVLAGANHRALLAIALGVFTIFFGVCGLIELEDPTLDLDEKASANPSFELHQDYLEACRKIDEVGYSYNYLFNHPAGEIWDDDQYGPGSGSGQGKR